jgi:hypothetical protein
MSGFSVFDSYFWTYFYILDHEESMVYLLNTNIYSLSRGNNVDTIVLINFPYLPKLFPNSIKTEILISYEEIPSILKNIPYFPKHTPAFEN